jgi:hypothetical protein
MLGVAEAFTSKVPISAMRFKSDSGFHPLFLPVAPISELRHFRVNSRHTRRCETLSTVTLEAGRETGDHFVTRSSGV